MLLAFQLNNMYGRSTVYIAGQVAVTIWRYGIPYRAGMMIVV